jgi:biotin synthase
MSMTRHNWTKEEIIAIYNKPMMDLLYEAATIHREHHDQMWFRFPTLSIKQVVAGRLRLLPTSARYHTGEGNDLMSVSQVKAQALRAKSSGLPEYVWEQPGET